MNSRLTELLALLCFSLLSYLRVPILLFEISSFVPNRLQNQILFHKQLNNNNSVNSFPAFLHVRKLPTRTAHDKYLARKPNFHIPKRRVWVNEGRPKGVPQSGKAKITYDQDQEPIRIWILTCRKHSMSQERGEGAPPYSERDASRARLWSPISVIQKQEGRIDQIIGPVLDVTFPPGKKMLEGKKLSAF